MQVEADGIEAADEIAVRALEASRRRELILAADEEAVRRNEELTGVAHAETGHVAVVRAFDSEIVALIGERSLRVEGAGQGRVERNLAAVRASGRELRRRRLLETQRRVCRRRAGERGPVFVVKRGGPAIDDHRAA